MKAKKKQSEKAVRTTISMPMRVYLFATERQRQEGYNSLSAYFSSLAHRDSRSEEKQFAA